MNRRELIGSFVWAAAAALGYGSKLRPRAASSRQRSPSGSGASVALDELRQLAQDAGFAVTDAELTVVQAWFGPRLQANDAIARAQRPAAAPKYPRGAVIRPLASDNPLNAWYVKTSIKGAAHGPLAGKTVAIKDNVCVAGVPMMIGSRLMEGFVPDTDATIVTRLLDAGAEIAGKAVCESFCLSGGSHTADTGFVLNPHDHSRTTGGSSSGSGALVASRAVDLAIGCDQGGSIRRPSAHCGIVGLKPTWGLVPYTGIFLFESTIDHTGPMARTVYDCALMLEVLAGPDGLDPRQHAELVGRPYTKLLAGGAKGLRVGVLSEGFGLPESEPDVDALVRDAAQCFTRAGAMVTNVSVKEHAIARRCLLMVTAAGIGPMARDAMGSGWKGLYPMDMAGFYRAHKRERANSLPPLVKAVLLLNRVLDRTGDGLHYARAQNLAREVRAAYDKALDEVDVLVMPTVARRPPKLPPLNPDFATSMAAAEPGPVNTPQFNLTGHPALSVPCGTLDGLPIGMQIVGRVGDDATVLRAGQAFEQLA